MDGYARELGSPGSRVGCPWHKTDSYEDTMGGAMGHPPLTSSHPIIIIIIVIIVIITINIIVIITITIIIRRLPLPLVSSSSFKQRTWLRCQMDYIKLGGPLIGDTFEF